MRRNILAARKIRKQVDKLMLANSKANTPQEKTEITKNLLVKMVGGCTSSVKKNMDNWQTEIDAHHKLYDIPKNHNFKKHILKKATPEETHEIEAANRELLEKLRNKAFGLFTAYVPGRNRFMGGDITKLTLLKNSYHEVMTVEVKGITPGCSKAIMKTVKKRRKTTPLEARLFGEVLEVQLTWKNHSSL